MLRTLTIFLTVGAFLVGCSARPLPAVAQTRYVPPFSAEGGKAFAAAYRAKVTADAELKGVIATVSDPRGDQGFNINVTIDGRILSNLTRPQQDRIMSKAVFHLRNTVAEFQPKATKRLNVGLFFYDDLGRWLAMYAVTPEDAIRLH